MSKVFNVVVVDDNPETMEIVLKAVKKQLKINYNYDIDYRVLSKRKDVEQLNNIACDIVMFDCAMSGEDYDFQGKDEARYGFELLKEYRKKNKRTKIIFYSGSFDFEAEGTFDFSVLDFVEIINELNIFAIVNRDVQLLVSTIGRAIDELDTILISLEDLVYNYGENGYFYITDKKLSADELCRELKLGTEIGEEFRKEICSTIISYFMKFGDE